MWNWILRLFGWDAETTIREFEERFPGRCPICAYHRYGIVEGHVRADEPVPDHFGCPEGRP
jgi:hypothetical protein